MRIGGKKQWCRARPRSCSGSVRVEGSTSMATEEIVFYTPQEGAFTAFSLVEGTLKEHTVDKLPENDKNLVVQSPELGELVVLHSSTAGAAYDAYSSLLKPLLEYFHIEHTYIPTKSADTIAESAAKLTLNSKDSLKTIVVLGGDTSVHELVNHLPNLETSSENSANARLRIAVIPTGSGNALATSSGIKTPIDAVRGIFQSTYAPLSTFSIIFKPNNGPVNGPIYALVVASWGFHASLVADSERLRSKYKDNPTERFKEAARRLMQDQKQAYYGEVHSGSSKLYGDTHSYLLFTPVTQLEPGFVMSPDSKPPGDNKLHMIAIPELEDQEKELWEIMTEVYDGGKHVTDPRVTYKSISTQVIVTVDDREDDDMRRWCIDGSIVVAKPGKVVLDPPSSVCKGWHLETLSTN